MPEATPKTKPSYSTVGRNVYADLRRDEDGRIITKPHSEHATPRAAKLAAYDLARPGERKKKAAAAKAAAKKARD